MNQPSTMNQPVNPGQHKIFTIKKTNHSSTNSAYSFDCHIHIRGGAEPYKFFLWIGQYRLFSVFFSYKGKLETACDQLHGISKTRMKKNLQFTIGEIKCTQSRTNGLCVNGFITAIHSKNDQWNAWFVVHDATLLIFFFDNRCKSSVLKTFLLTITFWIK